MKTEEYNDIIFAEKGMYEVKSDKTIVALFEELNSVEIISESISEAVKSKLIESAEHIKSTWYNAVKTARQLNMPKQLKAANLGYKKALDLYSDLINEKTGVLSGFFRILYLGMGSVAFATGLVTLIASNWNTISTIDSIWTAFSVGSVFAKIGMGSAAISSEVTGMSTAISTIFGMEFVKASLLMLGGGNVLAGLAVLLTIVILLITAANKIYLYVIKRKSLTKGEADKLVNSAKDSVEEAKKVSHQIEG